jgi:hypothetical protein
VAVCHAITRARGSADLGTLLRRTCACPVPAHHLLPQPGDELARGLRTVPFEQSLVIVYRAVWPEALAMSAKHPPGPGPRFHTSRARRKARGCSQAVAGSGRLFLKIRHVKSLETGCRFGVTPLIAWQLWADRFVTNAPFATPARVGRACAVAQPTSSH